MQATLYPLQLSGVFKTPLWGGTRLIWEWNKQTTQATLGESWELTVRQHENCRVCNGFLQGKTLGELVDFYGADLTGANYSSAQFPLLIKLIDAGDALSIQVHPDDDYAARTEHCSGKTELWYIVEADAGAEIIFGLKAGVTREALKQAMASENLDSVLQRRPVSAGEAYFIPAGLPHAIGKGILIAEIQQNCDLTYRVYDYNRRLPDGSRRTLHIEKALDVLRPFTLEETEALRYAKTGGKATHRAVLADCAYFRVEKVDVHPNEEKKIEPNGKMRHLLCLSGICKLHCDGNTFLIKKGDSWLLPAQIPFTVMEGDAVFLMTEDGSGKALA